MLQVLADNESVAGFYRSLGYSVEPHISMGKRISANMPPEPLPREQVDDYR